MSDHNRFRPLKAQLVAAAGRVSLPLDHHARGQAGTHRDSFQGELEFDFIPVQGRCILFPIFSFHVGSEICRRSLAWVLLAAGDGPRCLSKPRAEGDKLVLKALFRAWAQPVGAASCVVPPRAAGQMHSTPVGSSTPPSTPSIPSLAWSWSLKPGGELSPQAGPHCFDPTAERFPKSPGSWAKAPGRASQPGGSHCPPGSPLGAFTSHLSAPTPLWGRAESLQSWEKRCCPRLKPLLPPANMAFWHPDQIILLYALRQGKP